MLKLQSLLTISLFSSRQDVLYYCKKAVENKYNISQITSFTNFRLNPSPINIVDSCILEQNQDFLNNPDSEFIKKSICVLEPETPPHILTSIEQIFPYTLSYPPNPQLLLSYIEILNSNQSNIFHPKMLMEKTEYNCPDTINGSFSGNSEIMKKIRCEIISAASCNSPVLLLGETGVGKSTAARLIHELSSRKLFKLQPINMATLTENLVESTLFGTLEGAYTDAKNREGLLKVADKGTVFMDEVCTMDVIVQAKLLVVLQDGIIEKLGSDVQENIDIRLISSTNADILSMLNNGTFRKDLFFRISDLIIEIPPIRQHKEDLEIMCHEFINDKNVTLTAGAIEKIKSYDWPGNIRELHQCLNRALIRCTDNIITPELIDFGLFN